MADYTGPQVAQDRVITFYCSKCDKAFDSQHTYDQPCPACGKSCADPREARTDVASAISAHAAAPASHAAGAGLTFADGKWSPPKAVKASK